MLSSWGSDWRQEEAGGYTTVGHHASHHTVTQRSQQSRYSGDHLVSHSQSTQSRAEDVIVRLDLY